MTVFLSLLSVLRRNTEERTQTFCQSKLYYNDRETKESLSLLDSKFLKEAA